MAISTNLEQPQLVTELKIDPDKAEEQINEAIRTLQRNIEILKAKSQEAP